jgi:hypothetical protein
MREGERTGKEEKRLQKTGQQKVMSCGKKWTQEKNGRRERKK